MLTIYFDQFNRRNSIGMMFWVKVAKIFAKMEETEDGLKRCYNNCCLTVTKKMYLIESLDELCSSKIDGDCRFQIFSNCFYHVCIIILLVLLFGLNYSLTVNYVPWRD